jgi:2,5-diketo-D-gluconate reductase B
MSPTVGSAHIPAVGLGTWELRGKSCTRLVAEALRLGYRHIDTAEMYDNELEVGEGLRSSGIARDEVFITTKVWPSHFAAPALERAARDSVARLRLACVDLLLLHWPNPQVPLRETIGALCKVKRNGLARHIGVSNFTVALLEEAVRLSEEPLVCNQIEVHPFLDQTKVIAATQRHHMAVVAYSPIARGRAKDHAVLARIGKAHGKTATQVSLRFLLQQGIALIPRTSRVERLKENLAIFDFELTDADMTEIAALARRDGRIVDFGFSPQWGANNRATNLLDSPPPCGEGLGVGVHLKVPKRRAPTPSPCPHSQRECAARGGGEHAEPRLK